MLAREDRVGRNFSSSRRRREQWTCRLWRAQVDRADPPGRKAAAAACRRRRRRCCGERCVRSRRSPLDSCLASDGDRPRCSNTAPEAQKREHLPRSRAARSAGAGYSRSPMPGPPGLARHPAEPTEGDHCRQRPEDLGPLPRQLRRLDLLSWAPDKTLARSRSTPASGFLLFDMAFAWRQTRPIALIQRVAFLAESFDNVPCRNLVGEMNDG